jgi:hypothetical protein
MYSGRVAAVSVDRSIQSWKEIVSSNIFCC